MDIEFCKCGGILEPINEESMKCRSCGAVVKKAVYGKITAHAKKAEIIVIEDNKPDLPAMDRECPECRHKRAYWWLIQTRSADEPPTQFFRCTKCRHVWREYK